MTSREGRLLGSLSLIILLLLTNGWASIICGDKQDIGINSEPSGCRVRVFYEGRETVKLELDENTPTAVRIPRWAKHVRIRVDKEGYHPQQLTITRSINGWLFGNLLIGGVIGIGIDFMSGAAYKLSPENVDFLLVEMNQQGKLSNEPPGNDLLILTIASTE